MLTSFVYFLALNLLRIPLAISSYSCGCRIYSVGSFFLSLCAPLYSVKMPSLPFSLLPDHCRNSFGSNFSDLSPTQLVRRHMRLPSIFSCKSPISKSLTCDNFDRVPTISYSAAISKRAIMQLMYAIDMAVSILQSWET
jgi:hypothetical protein